MTKDWTVDRPAHEWKPIEWDHRYHRDAVRPKFTNYWLAYREARLLTYYGVTLVSWF
jgi:hypothetical protein